jgi:uncharacterized protein (TIGR02452 family)
MPIERIDSNNQLPPLASSPAAPARSTPTPKDSLAQSCKPGGFFDPIIRFFKWLFCCGSAPAGGAGDDAGRLKLREVAQETMQALREGKFTTPSDKVVVLDFQKMKEGTVIYNVAPRVENTDSDRAMEYSVINADSVEAGLSLLGEGYKVAVVNFANENTPGGGFINGARAQEEAICRSTGLYASIAPSENEGLFPSGTRYKIPVCGCIYSPDVPVLRATEAEDFAWREDAPTLNFISSAAYHPRNRPVEEGLYKEGMRMKIKAQIQTAIDQKCSALVAGAFGCGAFGNDPIFVAGLYKEELAKRPGAFEKVVFAVFVAKDGDQKNLDAFRAAFSS